MQINTKKYNANFIYVEMFSVYELDCSYFDRDCH